jgi:hypothetical protein
LTVPTAPNEVWGIDFKGWFHMTNRQQCHPLTLTDGASRFLLACHACAAPTIDQVRPVMETIFRTYGLPQIIRSDNGVPFASTAPAGLSTLNVWWIKLGIRLERITPGRPQQNGRHERMHRTLKLETPIATDLVAQQQAFDTFRHTYNTIRPHEALGQTPPSRHYTASTRPYPDTLPDMTYPPSMQPRRVRSAGTMKWRGTEQFISECLIGEVVGLLPFDDRFFILYFAETPLAVWDDARRHWLPRRQAQQKVTALAQRPSA